MRREAILGARVGKCSCASLIVLGGLIALSIADVKMKMGLGMGGSGSTAR